MYFFPLDLLDHQHIHSDARVSCRLPHLQHLLSPLRATAVLRQPRWDTHSNGHCPLFWCCALSSDHVQCQVVLHMALTGSPAVPAQRRDRRRRRKAARAAAITAASAGPGVPSAARMTTIIPGTDTDLHTSPPAVGTSGSAAELLGARSELPASPSSLVGAAIGPAVHATLRDKTEAAGGTVARPPQPLSRRWLLHLQRQRW